MLAQQFINDTLAIGGFCQKYKIADVDGFKKMLNYVAGKDGEFSKKLKKHIDFIQQKFISSTHTFIDEALKPTADVGDLIKNYKSKQRDLKTVLNLTSSTAEKEFLVFKFSKFISSRLLEDDKSSNLNNINNMLTENEIAFIVGKENFDTMKKGGKVDIYECFRETIAPFRDALEKQTKNGLAWII